MLTSAGNGASSCRIMPTTIQPVRRRATGRTGYRRHRRFRGRRVGVAEFFPPFRSTPARPSSWWCISIRSTTANCQASWRPKRECRSFRSPRASVQADHVYVISPDRRLQLVDHEISAFAFDQPRGHRAPIDLFFRSLADQLGEGFAVILSGAGSDGALGARAVKKSGSIILVQDPNEADTTRCRAAPSPPASPILSCRCAIWRNSCSILFTAKRAYPPPTSAISMRTCCAASRQSSRAHRARLFQIQTLDRAAADRAPHAGDAKRRP